MASPVGRDGRALRSVSPPLITSGDSPDTEAGTTDANKVAEVLRAGSWNTVLGPLSFDAKGDPVKPDYAWFLVKNGSIRQLGN